MPSEAKIILDAHASGVIRFRRQPFAGRRRRDTGGPDDGLAEDPFSRHDNAISIDLIQALPEFHLDPEIFQTLLRGGGKLFRKGREIPRGAVDQHNSRGSWIDSTE